ncbi:hypothetical protein Aab01nite_70940 [Paractinoplanes abujensis]|uniref:Uncharacterized protein n=1 Tax=Paractinoplanes abujensis TaxID=882441 RepID=A0A7W7CWG8_9ACTN|nr:hypothetical protein [Actinoplanes abujensis]MBB4695912.1 hypothetical protein [Actinoplanes abujensis]GID23504.1 hypothetical protein Aab01nite_70940 [Actinoplanes abujensis]
MDRWNCDHGGITALALDAGVKNSLAIGFADGTVQIRDRTRLDSARRESQAGRRSAVLALSFDQGLLTAVLADHSAAAWRAAELGAPTKTYGP